MINYLIEDWLNEAETPYAMGQPDPQGGQSPTQDPYMNQNSNQMAQQSADMTQQNQGEPDMGQEQPEQEEDDQDDINNDPSYPDVPEEQPKIEDFEVWKNQYFKESIKGDTQKLVDLLSSVRDGKGGLSPYQKKFIDDNWNIQLLRQNANIDKLSKDIRRNIKDQIDKNNPASVVVNHINSVLQTAPTSNQYFIKLRNYGSLKGDLHRKFIGALIGGVQVGAGGNTEDLIYNEREYSISISTRFSSEWGEVLIGNWCMKEDDADRFLATSERKRLDEGSPQEKDVLRKRIIIESIANQYKTRAIIANVVDENGTIYTLGWDIAGSLKAAYTEGKILVKTKTSDNSEAMITDKGEIVPFMDVDILYAKETGQQNEDGSPEVEELPFMEKRSGNLYLTADLKTLKEATTSMQGLVIKELPYSGNPTDLEVISRCIYSSYDLLMRQC